MADLSLGHSGGLADLLRTLPILLITVLQRLTGHSYTTFQKCFKYLWKVCPVFFHNSGMIEVLINTGFYQLRVETWFSHPAWRMSFVWVACFILLQAWKVTCNRVCLGSKAQSHAFTTGCIFILCRGRNYFILFKEDLSLHKKPCIYSDTIWLSWTPSSHVHFLI